jgi:hypothetical protein
MNSIKLSGRTAFTPLSRQRGASLLEGIAYLGIAAIVVLGAVSLLTGAFSSAQSNRVAEEVVSIRTAVKKLYMGQSNGYPVGAAITPVLITANVFPATLTLTGAVINNAWGGTVTVAGGATANQFAISYTAVPQDACINIISGASGWVSIGGGPAGATGLISTFPVSPAAASGACTAGANTLIWTSL